MNKDYIIRKLNEVTSLQRVTEELRTFIDERVRQELEKADALPEDVEDTEKANEKIVHLGNANAYQYIQRILLKQLIEKQKEVCQLGMAYEYRQKKK
jgi:hypothetical protein